MQQFTVPQFIDVEDKIIGPITARQFVIMLGGFMAMVLFYKFFDFSLFIGSSILTFAVTGMFAFFKINGMPFHFFVLNFFETSKKSKIRVWLNQNDQYIPDETVKTSKEFLPAPKKQFNSSRLSELALIVDTRGAYRGEDERVASDLEEVKDEVKTIVLEV